MNDISPLRDFVVAMTHLVARTQDDPTLLREGRALLAPLLADDRWLPEDCAVLRPDRYAQYLLHADPLERFSVVSFVWGPGHRTPVHDHTVWGLVGMLRGAERCDEFQLESPDTPPRDTGRSHVMQPGDIEAVSPTVGDWHRVSSARTDGASISIHVYGANIGAVRRHRLDDAGRVIEFVSGYDGRTVPNLWDRSKAPPPPVPQPVPQPVPPSAGAAVRDNR
jgi:predicted metal-dependent enzyme (double-stranded beta helix superfamily)